MKVRKGTREGCLINPTTTGSDLSYNLTEETLGAIAKHTRSSYDTLKGKEPTIFTPTLRPEPCLSQTHEMVKGREA